MGEKKLMDFLEELDFKLHYAYHYLKRERRGAINKRASPFPENIHSWYSDCHMVRHAGGGLENRSYLNCAEAIEESARLFKRPVIELDFCRTYDGGIILLHDFASIGIADMTINNGGGGIYRADFMNLKISGQYTPLDLESLFAIMDAHKEIRIIVDGSIDIIPDIINAAKKVDCGILKRFIIQLYGYDDYKKIESMYHFEDYIFTLYSSGLYIWNFKEIVAFCLDNNIPVVTMPKEYVRNRRTLSIFNKYNIKVFAHTVNDSNLWKKLQNMGVWGIYTDFLY